MTRLILLKIIFVLSLLPLHTHAQTEPVQDAPEQESLTQDQPPQNQPPKDQPPEDEQSAEPLLNIKQVTSPNGLTAWLVEDHSLPIITLEFAFRETGAAYDPADKQGLSRLASNTMDEGAAELDSQTFQKNLRDLSINLRFTSGRDFFGGELKTLGKNKKRAFELLKLAVNEPRFDEEPVERMREANKARIRSSLSKPSWISARLLNDRAFEGHPYAFNSGGTLSTLDNITIEDLQNFTKHLTRDRLIIAAAGDITPDQLGKVIDQVFGDLPDQATPRNIEDLALQNAGKTYLYETDIPQTIIEMMQPGIDRKNKDYQAAQIMNFILGSSGFGSRLTEEIREKRGLTYGIYSGFIDLEHFDGLSVSTSTKNENVEDMLALIKKEWQRMQDTPISSKELKNAQTYLIGALPLSLTSTDQIAGLLLSLQKSGLPIDYLDQRERKIQNTTREEIQTLARTLLDKEQFVTILVGQPENIKNIETIESLPNVE